MKRFLTVLTIAAVLAMMLAPAAEAASDKSRWSWQKSVGGHVLIDSLTWSDAGNYVRTCTLIAGTLWDTTTTDLVIAGAEYVSVTFLSQNHNDDMDFTIYPQVSPDLNSWHTLATTFSVNNTAGSQVGGTANTGRDTTVYIAKYAADDSIEATAGAGLLIANGTDMHTLKASKYLRFTIDPDMSAGDTVYVQAVVTRIWPAVP